MKNMSLLTISRNLKFSKINSRKAYYGLSILKAITHEKLIKGKGTLVEYGILNNY